MTNEPAGRALSARLHDERGVIVGFVVKTLVIFAILGVVAFDAGQVVVDQIKAGDVAQTAAQAAADTYYSTKNEDRAKQAAIAAAADLAGLASEFIGYPNETQASGVRVLGVSGELERSVVVLDRTPFYAEGGGQIGDRGELVGERGRLTVEDTQRVGEAITHIGRLDGELRAGDLVEARVDEERRWGAARNHTGTHLLHRALRDVRGEQAKQAGSYVAPEGLRFDFPADGPTPRSALREVERIVNAQIRRNAAVTPEWMPIQRARELGADMFFGEKYVPESVRVVRVDGFSKELCGGTHVAATGQIGAFRITGESSIGAGLRRIESVTGDVAEELVAHRLEVLHEAARLLGDREENVAARVELLLARLRDAEKSGRQPRVAADRLDAAAALEHGQQAGKTTVVAQAYAAADAAALRGLADDLRGMAGRFVLAAASGGDGKPSLLVAASRDLVAEGFDASAVVRGAAPLIQGGGGGRADLAQAGGKDVSRLDEALAEARRLALEALRRIESA
jgi:alanyl-tRNA synthetase